MNRHLLLALLFSFSFFVPLSNPASAQALPDYQVWGVGVAADADYPEGGNALFRWNGVEWEEFTGSAVRISIGPDGAVYSVQSNGNIWKLVEWNWQQMPGVASDISAAPDGQLYCISAGKVMRWTGAGWEHFNGGMADNVAGGPGGQVLVRNSANQIWHWGGNWWQMPGAAHDVAFGQDGSLWSIASTYIYRWGGMTGIWDEIDSQAIKIDVAADGTLYAINKDNQAFIRPPGAAWATIGNVKLSEIAVGPLPVFNGCPDGQFKASYWNNAQYQGHPSLIRCEEHINYEWANGTPAPSITADAFSARWEQRIDFQGGKHRFDFVADDTMGIFINGAQVATGGCCDPQSAVVDVAPGVQDLRVDYGDLGGGATAKLAFSLVVDTDGDGIEDNADACPQQGDAGFGLNPDGCPVPPPDADGDGVIDTADACPQQGDAGYGLTPDGCPAPPPDSDADGIIDAADACPQQGDAGSGLNPDGCPVPPPDSDGDGIADNADACPQQGDAGLGLQPDGCPVVPADTDGDGVIDTADACPQKGDAGYGLDSNGCPLPLSCTADQMKITYRYFRNHQELNQSERDGFTTGGIPFYEACLSFKPNVWNGESFLEDQCLPVTVVEELKKQNSISDVSFQYEGLLIGKIEGYINNFKRIRVIEGLMDLVRVIDSGQEIFSGYRVQRLEHDRCGTVYIEGTTVVVHPHHMKSCADNDQLWFEAYVVVENEMVYPTYEVNGVTCQSPAPGVPIILAPK